MNVISGNMKYMQLELWIPIGKAHAQPKKSIIASLKGDEKIENLFEAFKELEEIIRRYEERTNRIVCYDELGNLYFAFSAEELGEFLARARNSERTIAAGKLAESKRYEDSGFWPDPQLLHEDRTKTMLRDHSLTIPRYSTLERIIKSLREAEKRNEEFEARIEALEQKQSREADSQ